MEFMAEPMDQGSAEAIVRWRYDGPYSMYNPEPGDIETLLRSDYAYYAVKDEQGELVGFWNFGEDARVHGYSYPENAVDVGAGMRPDLVGRGLGVHFMRKALYFARERYGAGPLRVTVAAFNSRAQRLGRALGFAEVARFERPGVVPGTEFVVLIRPSSAHYEGSGRTGIG